MAHSCSGGMSVLQSDTLPVEQRAGGLALRCAWLAGVEAWAVGWFLWNGPGDCSRTGWVQIHFANFSEQL